MPGNHLGGSNSKRKGLLDPNTAPRLLVLSSQHTQQLTPLEMPQSQPGEKCCGDRAVTTPGACHQAAHTVAAGRKTQLCPHHQLLYTHLWAKPSFGTSDPNICLSVCRRAAGGLQTRQLISNIPGQILDIFLKTSVLCCSMSGGVMGSRSLWQAACW